MVCFFLWEKSKYQRLSNKIICERRFPDINGENNDRSETHYYYYYSAPVSLARFNCKTLITIITTLPQKPL